VILKAILIECQRYYPEMLYKCYIVNTPMFFEGLYEAEIKPYISEKTQKNIIITGESTHAEL
jgi:hypothetical protein